MNQQLAATNATLAIKACAASWLDDEIKNYETAMRALEGLLTSLDFYIQNGPDGPEKDGFRKYIEQILKWYKVRKAKYTEAYLRD